METNRTYRRHVSTARLHYYSYYACADSLFSALSNCKGDFLDYRLNSLAKCLCLTFPTYFDCVDSLYTFLDGVNGVHSIQLVHLIKDYCHISSIEFYSNGDIKLHFFPYKYKCS